MLKPRRGEPVDEVKVALLIIIQGGVIMLGGRTEVCQRREIEGVELFIVLLARIPPPDQVRGSVELRLRVRL